MESTRQYEDRNITLTQQALADDEQFKERADQVVEEIDELVLQEEFDDFLKENNII